MGFIDEIKARAKSNLQTIVLPETEEGAAILSKENPAVYLFMSSKDIYWLAESVKKCL